jgi:hypothetical protein
VTRAGFDELLAARPWLLADGATGTNQASDINYRAASHARVLDRIGAQFVELGVPEA